MKTILLTGGTGGLGQALVERLTEAGARVLVHGRKVERYRADFASLAEVRALAAQVQASNERLDVLINNAGVGFGPRGGRRETSRDGFELRFAVNYLAPFLLTRLLLPLLKASAPARIVNVASVGQAPLDFDDLMLERGYDGYRAYGQSKLALIMFTFDLADELKGSGVTANAIHPATLMPTGMVAESGMAPRSTIDEGADAVEHLACSPELAATSGRFFDGRRPARVHASAYDEALRERLRRVSLELTGLA